MVCRSLIFFIGFGKMGEDALHFQLRMSHKESDELQSFLIRRNADSSHAGIYLDMNLCLLSDLCRCCDQLFHRIPAVDCRADLLPDQFFVAIGKSISQDQDRFLHACFSEYMCLFISGCRIAEHEVQLL